MSTTTSSPLKVRKTFVLIDNRANAPVNTDSYTTAYSKQQAERFFLFKKSRTNPEKLMFPDWPDKKEIGIWGVFEVGSAPTYKKIKQPEPVVIKKVEKPKTLQQTAFIFPD